MKPLQTPSGRLDVVDALRGFALLAIVLLHNLEHYNLIYTPPMLPAWMQTLDQWVWEICLFLMAGKAYATFSLLFGFSFYIQFRNARARGEDFRGRFAWRLVLLFLFSQLHALFYNGDILLLYTVVGFVLIPASALRDRTVLILAALAMLQPLELGRIVYALFNPDYTFLADSYAKYYQEAYPVMLEGSFFETLRSNIWNGQLYSNFWQVEAGRLFQTASLFLLGMLLGRRELFVRSEASQKMWRTTLRIAAVVFIPLWALRTWVPDMIDNPTIQVACKTAFGTWSNISFMALLVSLFTLWWFRRGNGSAIQRLTIPYGRMSLTNYIMQSIIGVTLYYHFGFGLYRCTGATATLLIGIVIFCAQLWFSRWWLARYRNGPLEYLWRRGTWIGSKR